MLIHNLLLSLLAAISFSHKSLASERIGETASFDLDKSRNRTSSLIQEGAITTTIIAYNQETAETKATYTTQIDYDLDILMAGNQEGTEKQMIEESFFTEEFIIRLRREQLVQTDNFKVKHLGYENVSNKDGALYKNCDILSFYDINMNISSDFNRLVQALANQVEDEDSDEDNDKDVIEDISIKMARKEGLPVLSVAKLDITGRHSGIRFKAGFDYIRDLDLKR